MTLPRSAFKSNRAFNNYIRSLPTDGSAGDINQISASYLGMPASTPTPEAPKPPKLVKPPKQSIATQSAAGQSVRTSRKAKKRTRLSDLRIRRPRQQVNTQLSIGAGGTGLNVGGY